MAPSKKVKTEDPHETGSARALDTPVGGYRGRNDGSLSRSHAQTAGAAVSTDDLLLNENSVERLPALHNLPIHDPENFSSAGSNARGQHGFIGRPLLAVRLHRGPQGEYATIGKKCLVSYNITYILRVC